MSAQEIVLCKTTDIEAACLKAGLPIKGASKAGLAQSLAGLGWTAAQVRTAGGAGPSKDDLAILESRVNGHIDDMTKQLNLRLKNQAYEITTLDARVTGAVNCSDDAEAAAQAAGAVAARAEALALKAAGLLLILLL